MGIDLQRIINSRLSISLASAILWTIPPGVGRRLANYIADRIAERRDSKLVKAVRANQWVVRGENLDREAMQAAVRETFRYTARSIYDLYHYVNKPRAANKLITLDQRLQILIKRPEFDDRGLMVVGLHFGNFDLALQTLCRRGLNVIALTVPDPRGGQRIQYKQRRKTGLNLVPTTISTLKQSVKYLRKGGVVITGIDRPIAEPGCRPTFFGRPTSLPTLHVSLALKAQVPVIVMVTTLLPDGKYLVSTSDMIEMDSFPDKELEVLRNAEKVLNIAEGFIRQAPGQWSMPLPVWPEVMEEVPI